MSKIKIILYILSLLCFVVVSLMLSKPSILFGPLAGEGPFQRFGENFVLTFPAAVLGLIFLGWAVIQRDGGLQNKVGLKRSLNPIFLIVFAFILFILAYFNFDFLYGVNWLIYLASLIIGIMGVASFFQQPKRDQQKFLTYVIGLILLVLIILIFLLPYISTWFNKKTLKGALYFLNLPLKTQHEQNLEPRPNTSPIKSSIETADWKTYNTKGFGFDVEFKYPEQWIEAQNLDLKLGPHEYFIAWRDTQGLRKLEFFNICIPHNEPNRSMRLQYGFFIDAKKEREITIDGRNGILWKRYCYECYEGLPSLKETDTTSFIAAVCNTGDFCLAWGLGKAGIDNDFNELFSQIIKSIKIESYFDTIPEQKLCPGPGLG